MEKRVDTGALFAVTTKTSPKSPDYSGEVFIDLNTAKVKDGKVLIRLAGWRRQTKTGAIYLSMMVDKYEKKEVKTPVQKIQEMDDDVPF